MLQADTYRMTDETDEVMYRFCGIIKGEGSGQNQNRSRQTMLSQWNASRS